MSYCSVSGAFSSIPLNTTKQQSNKQLKHIPATQSRRAPNARLNNYKVKTNIISNYYIHYLMITLIHTTIIITSTTTIPRRPKGAGRQPKHFLSNTSLSIKTTNNTARILKLQNSPYFKTQNLHPDIKHLPQKHSAQQTHQP